MRLVQEQPRPVEFVPEPHTDFVFAFDEPTWPILLTALGAAMLALGLAARWRRRRGRREP